MFLFCFHEQALTVEVFFMAYNEDQKFHRRLSPMISGWGLTIQAMAFASLTYFGIFLRFFQASLKKPPKNTNARIRGHCLNCAEEEIRTPTPVTALPPQSSASTSFATSASWTLKWDCKNSCSGLEFPFPDFPIFQILGSIIRKVVPLPISDCLTNNSPLW